ncbi:MAG: hypothetical protein M1294_04065 [Firmicutes bacterium]|jgi:hypothetical protein|uniref:Uncharacterized protein n=1 Tax=Sulfobacillus benefaciens TaxID=453960 RepID=A0A2T2X4G8_9FIRM|nr:hypothetical protein [Bacillota bacterium]MCL5013701.1 hypothetical protein [Bacillota bacterium]PSR29379.1 MAG: hypothetical protein C7B43_08540 [Sulfobacillus benefaciens]HBQ93771.1 hypothetical protein [Sulfobacillus sp.]
MRRFHGSRWIFPLLTVIIAGVLLSIPDFAAGSATHLIVAGGTRNSLAQQGQDNGSNIENQGGVHDAPHLYAPVGQLPEVPWAAGIPLILVAPIAAGLKRRRPRPYRKANLR